jgi:1-acyl-sn-glycerol-3-phosphate acyltransferase
LLRENLYAAWWWTVLGGAFLAGCFSVLMLRTTRSRWAAVRRIGRSALAAMGIPLAIRGFEKIPARGAVLVFNHSSYMYVCALAATLPGEPAIVAKRELAQQLVAGPILRRLGTPFVERYDVSGSLTDAATLGGLAREGRLLVFFPEGTFTRRAGLSGFYLGAFICAATSGFRAAARSASRSMIRCCPKVPIFKPSSGYATGSAKRCSPAAANRIWKNSLSPGRFLLADGESHEPCLRRLRRSSGNPATLCEPPRPKGMTRFIRGDLR